MSDRSATIGFVGIHGAFRGGWWFDRVRPLLLDAGHVVVTPDLTGMGPGLSAPDPGSGEEPLRLDDWIDDVDVAVDEAHAAGGSPVVLAGHSQGGMVIAAAAPVVRDRVAELVYLDAPVPLDGQRGVDLAGPRGDAPLPPADFWIDPAPTGPESGLGDDDRRWVDERLCATPVGPSLDPITRDSADAIAETYAFCDGTAPGYPATVTRARFDDEGTPYRRWDAPHDVAISHPELVAALLSDVAARLRAR